MRVGVSGRHSAVWGAVVALSAVTPVLAAPSIDVTFPDSSAVWYPGGSNGTYFVRYNGATGSHVYMDLYRDGAFIDSYHPRTSNDGRTDTPGPRLEWGSGSDFQIRVNDYNGNYGLSAPFTMIVPEAEWVYDPDPDQAPQQPDLGSPSDPDYAYNFAVSLGIRETWTPLVFGVEGSFAIPFVTTVEFGPPRDAVVFPSEPLVVEPPTLQFGFGTNNGLAGRVLELLTPWQGSLIETESQIGIAGNITLAYDTGIDFEKDQLVASAEASVSVTVDAAATIRSDLLDALGPIGDLLNNTEIAVQVPIKEAKADLPEVIIPLGIDLRVDPFREAIAAYQGVPVEALQDFVYIDGYRFDLSTLLNDQHAGLQFGGTSSVFARTEGTRTVNLSIEQVDSLEGLPTLIDALGQWGDEVIDWGTSAIRTSATSATGVVETVGGRLGLQTGSPAWIATIVEVDDGVDTLIFDAAFTSEDGAEGLLSIFWEGELIATIDERLASDDPTSYFFELPQDGIGPGFYELTFRLDPYTDTASSIEIDSVAVISVPEPTSLIGMTIGLCMLHRRRSSYSTNRMTASQ